MSHNCISKDRIHTAKSETSFSFPPSYPQTVRVLIFISLATIVAMDSLAAGIVGTVNIAFLTSLVSKKYTGFQYALLTGFMAGPGFALKGLSGVWANYLQEIFGFENGWMGFYITTSILTIPSIMLLVSYRNFLTKHENTI